ncbi:MAG: D-alanine--D-alanine ligase, partial [Bacteroidetes bacterium]
MKKNIAVVSGGDSGEYEISVKSGKTVEKHLDKEKYAIYPIRMKGNDWHFEGNNGEKTNIDKNDFSLLLAGIKIRFDAVFIAIHGTPGEDGKLQGYFDMLDIPYSSSDHATSALAFNKYFCKNFVAQLDVLTAKAIHLTKDEKHDTVSILNNLSLPVFVKPNNGGSSVGMSKVNKAGELQYAIEKAFNEDNEILIEEFIEGREITCGILKKEKETIIFPLAEVKSKNEFFDYEAKYNPSLADEIIPAQIPNGVTEKCKRTSEFLYEKLKCKGIVRFDYILNDKGMYFLEVNTIPRLIEESFIPQM